jgi:hypothetical protein
MSIFDRCQYRTLVDLANALQLHLPNRRRQTITDALLNINQPPFTMALTWDHIAEPVIAETGTRLGLVFPAAADRAARVALLQAANVAPIDCLRTLLPAAPAGGAQKVTLQRQHDTEHHLAFLDRASMVLAGLTITDPEKNRQLLNAAQPGTAEVIIQVCSTQPAITFADLITELRSNFAIQPSTAGMRYLQARPAHNETYIDFGRRLQQLYQQYLGADRTTFQQHARWITPALIMKLFTVLPPAIRGHLQVAYDKDHAIGWNQFCLLADSFVASHPTPRSTGQFQPKPPPTKDAAKTGQQLCAKHGLCAHTTAECRVLKRDNSRQEANQNHRNTAQRRQFNVSNIDYTAAPNELPTLGHGGDPEQGDN